MYISSLRVQKSSSKKDGERERERELNLGECNMGKIGEKFFNK
jgi:hypothetical protein